MLASGYIPKRAKYWAQQIPGTKVVAVEKKKSYSTNWNDFGHSFERFVLGQCNTEETVMHLQIIKMGGYRVLFAAETDGMDKEERSVEIKSSMQKDWGRVSLQMISNGSQSLYIGTKSKKRSC